MSDEQETVEPRVVAGIAVMQSTGAMGTPIGEKLDRAFQAAIQKALDEGISVYDADAMQPRILAARDAALEEHESSLVVTPVLDPLKSGE